MHADAWKTKMHGPYPGRTLEKIEQILVQKNWIYAVTPNTPRQPNDHNAIVAEMHNNIVRIITSIWSNKRAGGRYHRCWHLLRWPSYLPKMSNKITRFSQWNCRGFSQTKVVPQQHIQNADTHPDIIPLQEVGKSGKRSWYKLYQAEHNPVIRIQRNIPANWTGFDTIDISDDFTTILPRSWNQTKLFLLNICSKPKAKDHN